MEVRNFHSRQLRRPVQDVGPYLDSLSSPNDLLWPHEHWPPMVFGGPLAEGAKGGHGPIRYVVEKYEPGRRVILRFTAPAGFDGVHYFTLEEEGEGTKIGHTIEMRISGPALLTWPLFIRPLHDALLEDALDKVEAHLSGKSWTRREWKPWVKLLRKVLAKRRSARSKAGRTGS